MRRLLDNWQIALRAPVWGLRIASDVAASVAGIVQSHLEDIRAEVYGLAATPMKPDDVERVGQMWQQASAARQERTQSATPPPQSTDNLTIDQIIALGADSGVDYRGPVSTLGN